MIHELNLVDGLIYVEPTKEVEPEPEAEEATEEEVVAEEVVEEAKTKKSNKK